MNFQSWNNLQRSATRPTCNCGSNSSLELIDVVVDTSKPAHGSTTPIWWCGNCLKTLGGRSSNVETEIASNGASCMSHVSSSSNITASVDVSQSSIPNYSVMYNEVQRIFHEMMNNYSFTSSYNYSLDNKVRNTVAPEIQNVVSDLTQKMEERLRSHLEEVNRIESDPLHEVRKRTANFRLI